MTAVEGKRGRTDLRGDVGGAKELDKEKLKTTSKTRRKKMAIELEMNPGEMLTDADIEELRKEWEAKRDVSDLAFHKYMAAKLEKNMKGAKE